MKHRKRVAGTVALCLAVGAAGVAAGANSAAAPGSVTAHSAAAPRSVTVREKSSLKMVPNRYLRDGLRWSRDVYTVRSGGEVTLVSNIRGPHTLSTVTKSDLPRSARQMNDCAACRRLGQAHGADFSGNSPPRFQFVENGVGQSTPPNLDRPGDSGLTGPGRPNERISFRVTAKKGTDLYFLCLLHPWMQAELRVR
jgi:hypothetical protein